ncbi:hypothetical protein, partial [Pandoraea sp.]|uniref:hypothetical protein n=1 Tax=Pandoraea sp. TaxID=1883445 RepID=UPI0025F67356
GAYSHGTSSVAVDGPRRDAPAPGASGPRRDAPKSIDGPRREIDGRMVGLNTCTSSPFWHCY